MRKKELEQYVGSFKLGFLVNKKLDYGIVRMYQEIMDYDDSFLVTESVDEVCRYFNIDNDILKTAPNV